MNGFAYKGYTARVIFSPDDEMLTGTLAGIDDCVIFQATSVPELKLAFRSAVDDYLKSCAEVGKAPDKPASGKVFLHMAPRVHAAIRSAADATGQSLSKWAEALFARECGLAL
ncbi:MAG: type II toxin-antitoxin system HicB family antitoxin [Actinomycetaceae bacterium]|nr:type II toxin-antitoxin system HicB family antitoxin [Actinomycetaceae bacterium]